MHPYLSLAIAIISEVIATTALKSSDGFSKLGPSLLVVIGYAISFYFLSLSLKAIPIGIAYAIWSGCGIILISALAFFMFGQKLDLPAIIGLALIIIGVLVVNLFSKTVAH